MYDPEFVAPLLVKENIFRLMIGQWRATTPEMASLCGNRGMAFFRFDGVVCDHTNAEGTMSARYEERGGLVLSAEMKKYGTATIRQARKAHRCYTKRERVKVETHRSETAVSWRYDEVGPPLRGWDKGPLPEGHTPEIQPGQLYVEEFGEAPIFGSGLRFCEACARASGLLNDTPHPEQPKYNSSNETVP